MKLEIWKIVQVKKALDQFCEARGLPLNDDLSVRVASRLMDAAYDNTDDPDTLFDLLQRFIASEFIVQTAEVAA